METITLSASTIRLTLATAAKADNYTLIVAVRGTSGLASRQGV